MSALGDNQAGNAASAIACCFHSPLELHFADAVPILTMPGQNLERVVDDPQEGGSLIQTIVTRRFRS
jgi:hypothetical protein